MKVEEFIKLTKGKKDYDFSQRIKLKYMPYTEKCALVKSVIENTSYIDVNGKKVYKRDTASMLFVFIMQLISKYTDLEFEKDNVVIVYDALMETKLMDQLLAQIPESEISFLKGMLDMQRDDFEFNTRSLVSFFETRADAMQMALDGISNVLEKSDKKTLLTEQE